MKPQHVYCMAVTESLWYDRPDWIFPLVGKDARAVVRLSKGPAVLNYGTSVFDMLLRNRYEWKQGEELERSIGRLFIVSK